MSLLERVKQITTRNLGAELSIEPTPALQKVVDASKILELFNQISSLGYIESERAVIEGGRRMVLTAKWGQTNSQYSQMIVSITEGSISFIGSHIDNQYIRLEGKHLKNQWKIENALTRTFSNPQRYSSPAHV